MSASCVCRIPKPVGEGEQEHCEKCGAWTAAAIEANYARKERERAARVVSALQDNADLGKRGYTTKREADIIARATPRCAFCGSAKHALADCTANGAVLFRSGV